MRKILIVSLTFLLICAAIQAHAFTSAMQAVISSSAASSNSGTYSITASNDDTFATEGSIANNSADNIMVGEGADGTSTFEMALRFTNVTIPKGTTVTHAYLHVIAHNDLTGVSCNIRITGQAADDGATFNTTYADVFGRTATTAYADWTLPTMTAGTSYSSASQTVDLKDIITEIVGRAGWASGNHIVIFLKANSPSNYAYRTIISYDYTGNASGPTLEVSW